MKRLSDNWRGGIDFLKQWSVRGAVTTVLVLAVPRLLSAQAPPPAPVVTASRSWYFEALIVVVMMGLALFVVCRSSRRN